MRMVVELEGYNGFEELYKNSWSGAIDRLDTIKQYHMEEELMEHLDMVFECCEELPTDEQVNNYLAYEFDAEQFVAENISFNTLEDLDELEDYAKNLYFSDAQSTITEVRQQNKEEKLWEYLQYGFDMRNLLEVMEELADFDFDNLEEE
jgi:hypothetical protein